jgi:hypothetical protein
VLEELPAAAGVGADDAADELPAGGVAVVPPDGAPGGDVEPLASGAAGVEVEAGVDEAPALESAAHVCWAARQFKLKEEHRMRE